MGAWGYGPYDNDTAADWFLKLNDTGFFNFIEAGLNSKWDEEVRAAAWLVSQLGESCYVYNDRLDEHKELAINKLEDLLNNDDWISTWDDETAIKQALQRQIDDLKYYRPSGPFSCSANKW